MFLGWNWGKKGCWERRTWEDLRVGARGPAGAGFRVAWRGGGGGGVGLLQRGPSWAGLPAGQ